MANTPPESEAPPGGDDEDTELVTVTAQGQATIPKRFREELGLEAPGKVQFRKTEDGEIVVEAPTPLTSFIGMLSDAERSPAEMLRESREQDKHDEDEERSAFVED